MLGSSYPSSPDHPPTVPEMSPMPELRSVGELFGEVVKAMRPIHPSAEAASGRRP